MTDDICGAETAEGTPCQHPAGDNGYCWVPQHNPTPDGGTDPGGRDFVISDDDHEDILDAARAGLSRSGCARAAGTDKDSLRRYLDAHDEFRADFMRAREKGERRLAERGLMDPDVDGQMARFLLSTSFGYVKTEKRELEHSGEVTHDTPAEFVSYGDDDESDE